MFRPAFRGACAAPLSRALPKAHVGRRFVSTAPPHQKSRSWRSSAVRWGLAGALVYYYNTSSTFAEQSEYALHAPPETSRESEAYPTVASISDQRRAQSRSQTQPPLPPDSSATVAVAPDAGQAAPGSAEELEEEAGQEGAFNEETGEINWDCPCLGGMAHGPCGEQFKAAFSCFVFSKEEPKGVDCIEHFKTMQNCFREHPDVYGSELEDDEDAPIAEGIDAQPTPAIGEAAAPAQAAGASLAAGQGEKASTTSLRSADDEAAVAGRRERAVAAKEQVQQQQHEPTSETEEAVPKAWHDSREVSTSK